MLAKAVSSTVWRGPPPVWQESREASPSESLFPSGYISQNIFCGVFFGSLFAFFFSQTLMLSLRFMQEVNVSDSVRLLDSPGIIASPSNSPVSLALRGLEVGRECALEAVRCLLNQCDQTLVRGIPMTRNTDRVSVLNLKLSVVFFPPRLRSSITSLTSGTPWSFWPCLPRSMDTSRRAKPRTQSRQPQFSLLIGPGDYFSVFLFFLRRGWGALLWTWGQKWMSGFLYEDF